MGESDLGVLRSSGLFRGIDDADIQAILKCLNARERAYQKEEIIYPEGARVQKIGFILEGQVDAVQEDFWGNQMLIGRFMSGDIFGEAFVLSKENDFPYSAVSYRGTRVLFLDYDPLADRAFADCPSYDLLLRNLLHVVGKKSMILLRKMGHIAKRTTREKLLSFLSERARKAGGNHFSIEYNRQGLANYLGVDRSALSTELSRMQKEGLLTFERNTFELHPS